MEKVEKFLESANEYLKQSDWKDLAMIKFCLFAIGIIVGLSIPKEKRKLPLLLATLVFIVTYIPLMIKYMSIAVDMLCADVEVEDLEEDFQ